MGEERIDNKSLQNSIVPSLILLRFKLSGVFLVFFFILFVEIPEIEQYGVVDTLNFQKLLGLIIVRHFLSPSFYP